MQRFARYALTLSLVLALFACSSSEKLAENNSRPAWIADGVLALVRSAPAISQNRQSPLLGFVPLASVHQGSWLSINKAEHKLALYDGENLVAASELSGSESGLDFLAPGSYQVLHKQRAPLWYATDAYYSRRGLNAPPQNDRNRYLKGALGEFALFIAKDLPLHSGPVWTEEVGGVRLNETDISRIYYSLPVGAVVEVK